MTDFYRITLLFDFYSELLTEKQKEFMTLYYFDDLSLNEIAQNFDITPQGVRDLLKRTEKLLFHYEAKLKLLEKHNQQKEKMNELIIMIDQNKGINHTDKIKLLQLLEELSE